MCRAAARAAVAMLGIACGGEREARRAEAGAAPGAAPTVAGPANARRGTNTPVCPATGAWQPCSVVERLERAGLAPRQQPHRVLEPPLSSPGIAILLGRSELRVFIYADHAARERDQSKLDTTKYATAAQPLAIQAEPTVIASENLLAILRSRSDHQRERVSDALTAGPPQPSQPKR